MRLRVLLLAVLALTGASALPAVAVADHEGGPRGEEIVPPPATGGADDGGSWFDDVEDSGDDPPADDPAPVTGDPGGDEGTGGASPAPTPRPAAGDAGRLRGVPYRDLILRHARRRGLEPTFVAAIVHTESAFRPRAVSRVGARGLMQLMPATARGMGAKVSRLFDPATNIAYGTRYLQEVRRAVGSSPRLMAAAYNAGPGAVRRFGGVPPYAETRTYVRRVLSLRDRYRGR